jgi:hypothetical protein
MVTFERYHQSGGNLLWWYAADSTTPLCNNRVNRERKSKGKLKKKHAKGEGDK